jgi:hypothetical protein
VVRLVIGLVLLGEGALVAFGRLGARRVLVERLLRRTAQGRWSRYVLAPLVLGVAMIFAGFGAYMLVRAGETAL